jgi:hypothetical protein
MTETTRGTLLVFAREPVPGRVKTRLIPAVGKQRAAAIYKKLLGVALEAASGVPGVQRELWCDSDDLDRYLRSQADRYGMTWHKQVGVDLQSPAVLIFRPAVPSPGRFQRS